MKKMVKNIVLGTLASMLLFSCASNKLTKDDAKLAYNEGDYETVETYLAENNEKGEKIDLNLNEAMLLDAKGMTKEAADLLQDIYKQMQQLTGEMSVGDMMAAALGSEEAFKYSGPAYEFNMLDAMSAFNFIKLGDVANARAMMNRFYEDNKAILVQLRENMIELQKESEKNTNSETTKKVIEVLEMAIDTIVMSAGLPPLLPGFISEVFSYPEELKSIEIDDSFGMSPFEFYLRAILLANNGQLDEAKKILQDGMKLFNSHEGGQLVTLYDDKEFFEKAVAMFDESIVQVADSDKGSIQVVTMADNIAQRATASKERVVWTWPVFETEDGGYYGFDLKFKLTWPTVEENDTVVKGVKVSVTDTATKEVVKTVDSVLVEDFDKLVEQDAMANAKGAYIRSVIRNISRKGTAFAPGSITVETAKQLTVEMINQGMPMGLCLKGLEKALEGLQAAIDAIDNGEFSDERQCAFFPSKARNAGVVLLPGVYDVTVEYLNAAGETVKTDVIPAVEVKAGVPSVVASAYINTGNIPVPAPETEAEAE